jgi:hypothetical protein
MSRAFCACFAFTLALAPAVSAAHAERAGLAQFAQAAPAQPELQSPPVPVAPQLEPTPTPSARSQPSADLRNMLQGPVQVQVVPSPKTEAELDAEQRDHDERAALNQQLTIYGGLLVAVGVFLALAFAAQVLYLGLALRAVRRATDLAQRNAITAQRAFVYLGELTWYNDGAGVRITPIWANAGTTPTKSLRITTNWKASHGELAADFAYIYARPPEPLFLGPNGRAEIGAIVIPMRDIEAALEQKVFLYIWGRAAYEDVFDGSKPHFFEFCHRVVVTGATPNNVALAFSQHGLRNCTDQDKPVYESLSERS